VPDFGRELDDRYRIQLLADPDSIGEQAVIDLWTANAALEEADVATRIGEVLFVAADEGERAVGVSTVYLAREAQLGMDLWHYRTYIAPGHRESNLGWLLMFRSQDHLRELFTSGEDTRGQGVFFALQNRPVQASRNRGMWRNSRFAFIAEGKRGAHHRVSFFPGALAPEPPQSHS
jgi:hypothetical protein